MSVIVVFLRPLGLRLVKVKDSVIMTNTKIKAGALVNKAIIGGDVIVEETSLVGNGKDIAVVGEGQVVDGEWGV